MSRVEAIQYHAARVVPGARKGTSREKLYEDLGWESLYHCRNARRLCILYEIINSRFPLYLHATVEECISKTNRRHLEQNKILSMPCRTKQFPASFFPIGNKALEQLGSRHKK